MASINDTLIMGGATSFADALDKLGIKYQLYDNPGISSSKDRDWIGSATRGNQVPVWDGQQFKLMQGDKLLYEGGGIDGLRQATAMTDGLGKGWRIISSAPDGTDEAGLNEMFAKDGTGGIDYGGQRRSDFGDFLPYALLAALPFAAATALPALGAAGASGGGGAAGAGAASGAAGAGGAGLGASAGLGAALPAFEGITVLGGAGGLGAGTAAGLGAAAAGLGAAATGGGSGAAGAGAGAPSPADITVVGNPTGGLNVLNPIDLAALGAAGTAPIATGAGSVAQPTTSPPKSTLDKIANYAQLGSLGVGLLGNLLGGGGGSGGQGRIPGGLGGDFAPVFTDKLPEPNIPGTAAGTTGARTMPEQDWYRYAMRPEQSFFNYVPQGYTPPTGVDPKWDRDLAVNGG